MKLEEYFKEKIKATIKKAEKRLLLRGGVKLTDPKEIKEQEDLTHRRGKYSVEA